MITAAVRASALIVVVAALASCGGGAASRADDASPVATAAVDLPKSYRFAPVAIVVPVGSTVTWTNHDDFTHNVTLPDGSPVLTMAPGASVSHTFDTPGTYDYMCSLHPKDMRGRVVVSAS